ncbi:MAG TPA: hypothetical protein VHK69_21505 [Chitinophagaceae bacterium]|jgi:hypothetical protein|nr:hypothetical protein [Chitinophagaceae bacterium]
MPGLNQPGNTSETPSRVHAETPDGKPAPLHHVANENPRANENLDEEAITDAAAATTGSEITDGEDA